MTSISYRRLMLVSVPAVVWAAGSAGAAGPGSPSQEHDLLVANRGARPITELHVSSSQADDWGDDRLGGAGLKPGQTFRVRLGRGPSCRFDVIATYADGRQEEADELDVCADRRLAFDGSTAQGPAAADRQGTVHQVTIADRSPLDIVELYLSAADGAQWGEDRLEDAGLPNGALASGASTTLAYRGGCQVDVRVVFENKAAEERRDLNICARPAVTIVPGWTTQEGDTPAPSAPGLTLHNRSGHAITALYVYPDGAEAPGPDGAEAPGPDGPAAHGPDLLSGQAVPDGGSVTVAVTVARDCRGTIRAVLEGHQGDIIRRGVDLCSGRELVLDGGPGAAASAR